MRGRSASSHPTTLNLSDRSPTQSPPQLRTARQVTPRTKRILHCPRRIPRTPYAHSSPRARVEVAARGSRFAGPPTRSASARDQSVPTSRRLEASSRASQTPAGITGGRIQRDDAPERGCVAASLPFVRARPADPPARKDVVMRAPWPERRVVLAFVAILLVLSHAPTVQGDPRCGLQKNARARACAQRARRVAARARNNPLASGRG